MLAGQGKARQGHIIPEDPIMASKRHLRRRICAGKQRYPTLHAARAAIARLQTSRSASERMNAYQCAFCGALHIGHTPRELRS